MLYCLIFAIGGTLGFLLFAWVRGAPTEPYIAHDQCDDRFNRMHKRLSHEIHVREDEIQRLIQGEVAYQSDAGGERGDDTDKRSAGAEVICCGKRL